MVPQGIAPATDIFQSRMVALFAPMMEKKPDPYLDDILHTKGNTLAEHVSILCEILRRIREAGLKCNAKKCRFAHPKLVFMGFMLEQKGHKPLKSRMDAILRINPLTNVKKVREFLGIINFIKNHIPNKAIILEPIT